jgi:hypothetical protein
MRHYQYTPRLGTVRDVRVLWVDDGGAWLCKGWLPPAALLPGGAGGLQGAKGAIPLTRTQAAWLLSRWRLARRTAGARLTREAGEGARR